MKESKNSRRRGSQKPKKQKVFVSGFVPVIALAEKYFINYVRKVAGSSIGGYRP